VDVCVLALYDPDSQTQSLLERHAMDLSPLFAAAQLDFTGPYFLSLLSRVMHTTCAATLLGGLIYMRFVLAPATPEGEREAALFHGRRKAWAMCVMICTLLLLVSGVYNLIMFLGVYKNLPKLYHPLFGVKFLLSIGVMAIMAFIAGKTALAQKMRANLTGWLNLALVMALSVFVLGAMLRSFRDLPDARAAVAVAEEAPAFGDAQIETAE
jgi:putative copper export protein